MTSPDTPAAGETAAGMDLGAVMSRTARQLQEEHGDVEATLQAITTATVATITHARSCGISFITGRRRVQPRAWTSDLARDLDVLQGELGQGPCLDAVWEERVVSADDIGADPRWTTFGPQAAQAGAGSMLCFQLFIDGDRLGALNLYATETHVFDHADHELGQLLASHAAIALAGARNEESLAIGLSHRDVIGQAKGILMERFKITADQAFELLVRSSSLTNRKLYDIAAELTDTGALPTRSR